MSFLFSSKGIKRLIAAGLSALIAIVTAKPELQFLAPYIAYIASAFGIVGLTSASYHGTLLDFKTLTLASVFQVLTEAAKASPVLLPYVTTLQLLASLLGVTGLATSKPTISTSKY